MKKQNPYQKPSENSLSLEQLKLVKLDSHTVENSPKRISNLKVKDPFSFSNSSTSTLADS